MGHNPMPATRIHFDVSYGVDAGAATMLFASSPAANAIVEESTPPAPPPPDFSCPKPNFPGPGAHLLREVTA